VVQACYSILVTSTNKKRNNIWANSLVLVDLLLNGKKKGTQLKLVFLLFSMITSINSQIILTTFYSTMVEIQARQEEIQRRAKAGRNNPFLHD